MLFIVLTDIPQNLLHFLDGWGILHINLLFLQLTVKRFRIFFKDLILVKEGTPFFKSPKLLCFSLDLLFEYFFSDGEVVFSP